MNDKTVKNDYVVVVRILEDNTIQLVDPKDFGNVYEFGVPDEDQILQIWLKEHVKTVWGAHVGPTYHYNPAHLATCGGCGKEMAYNVPRLGPDGGFVHKDTGKLLCENNRQKEEDVVTTKGTL